MEKQIIIDIGSGKTKSYIVYGDKSIKDLYSTRIRLKERYNPAAEGGINREDKDALFDAIKKIKAEADKHNIKAINVFATSIFRIMPEDMLAAFKAEFKQSTGLDFKVLSQQEENELTTLPVSRLKLNAPYLAVCIGAGSTEMAVFDNGKKTEDFTVEFARADLLKAFPNQLGQDICNTEPEILRDFVRQNLTFPQTKCKYMVVVGGGALSKAEKCGFKMNKNSIFADKAMPSDCGYKGFIAETNKLLLNKTNAIPGDDLESLRAHCIIAGCIMEAAGAEHLFMTNLNLMNGIVQSLGEKQAPTRDGPLANSPR